MNAAETIQAAIDKLMDQASAADHGPYYVDDHIGNNGHVVMGQAGRIAHLPSDVHTGAETAELIVTLHATIEAQLHILQAGRAIYYGSFGNEVPPEVRDIALNLAHAILGEQADS